MTPASSIANLAAFAEAAEAAEKAKGLSNNLAPVAEIPAVSKNALGEINAPPPDLAAAVTLAVRRDFEDAVAIWQRDVRGRFLAHLKVLYWESLEEGRATKEVVETLVECADIALDELDAPLCDWTALRSRVLGKAQKGSSPLKRAYRGLPSFLKFAVKWTRQWVLHSGAVGAGGSRRRALVAAALFHDARREAAHAIFGHLDGDAGVSSRDVAMRVSHDKENEQQSDVGATSSTSVADVHVVSLPYDGVETPNDGPNDADARDPAFVAARRVRAEAEKDADAAKAYLRAARTNEPELAAAVKSEETARRLLATAERSARGYVQSGLLTEAEAAELLSLVSRAQRRLRLDPPEPITRDPRDLMRMSPLLDPTHAARVRDPELVERLIRDAPGALVRRFPGDLVDATALGVPPGGLLVLARGVVDVEWSKPIGEGGGGGSDAPLRVGASSTSYGWALGAADTLAPGAARFKARAVSTVTAFALPPDLVRSMLSAPSGVSFDTSVVLNEKEKEERDTTRLNGTAEALWRAAFGLLAATVLRDDLAAAAVPARATRQAATRGAISRKEVGARVGPYDSRRELVVLLAGEVYDETEGALVGPCVLAPRDAAAAASRLFGADPARAAAFGKLAARMGMSSQGAAARAGEKKITDGGAVMRGTSVFADASAGGFGGEEHMAARGGALRVNERATILRAPLTRGAETENGPTGAGPGGLGGSSFRGSSSLSGGNISSPPKVTSYLPGLEGSGWGKFGKNPLLLSRAAALRDEYGDAAARTQSPQSRRLSVNVGSLGAARARAREDGRDPDAEFSRFLSDTRAGNKASTRSGFEANETIAASRGDDGVATRADSEVGAPTRTLVSSGAPRRPVDAFDGTEAVSARNRVLSGFSPPATSEGSDIYTSSLDRTTAHILARDIKRDIFAPRRRSLDARAKAVAAEAAALAGSAIAGDASFRAGVASPRASLGSVFGARGRDTGGDTFPPREVPTYGGGSPGDTFPPRPAGGGPRRAGPGPAARRGSLGAALFKASGGGSSANPEETFPPRRSRGVSVAKPKVVEWTHEASSSEDEATIRF